MPDPTSPALRRKRRTLRSLVLRAGLIVAFAFVLALAFVPSVRWKLWSVFTSLRGRAKVEDRLAQYGERARAVWKTEFERVGLSVSNVGIVLTALKEEKRLEVWAIQISPKQHALLKSYPILAASGGAGPKTREGDRQVPEGVYKVESLNPNSLYHLALRLDYPNEEDIEAAKAEGRTNLGGDIMIHGSDASIGCLAMGDPAIEELFVLVADVGLDRVDVVIVPWDFSERAPPKDEREWMRKRYTALKERLELVRATTPAAQPGHSVTPQTQP
jgi:hypothetical protein